MLDMILRFKCKPKTGEGAYVKTYLKDHQNYIILKNIKIQKLSKPCSNIKVANFSLLKNHEGLDNKKHV